MQFLLGNSFNSIDKSMADDWITETIKIVIVESERIAYRNKINVRDVKMPVELDQTRVTQF